MTSRPTRPPPPPPPPPPIVGQYGDDSLARDLSLDPSPYRPSNRTTTFPNRGVPGNRPVSTDSSSDDDGVPAPVSKRPSLHSRSMSNPFPSLFSGKKKKASGGQFDHPRNEGLANHNDDSRHQPQSNPRAQPTMSRKASRGPADHATGHCMTCSSLVRWPKELQVFRCTICLTINDLKPLPPDPPQNEVRQPARDPRHPPETGSGPSCPLRLDGKPRTSSLSCCSRALDPDKD